MNNKKLIKVYRVEFMEYNNCLKDCVSYKKSSNISDYQYINLGKHEFLVKEYELEEYKKFGKGLKKIEFVGNVLE